MAKVLKVDGRTFVQPDWKTYDKEYVTVLNDNRRERRELNMLLLQMKVDELAKTL